MNRSNYGHRTSNGRSTLAFCLSGLFALSSLLCVPSTVTAGSASLEQILNDSSGSGNRFFGDLYGEHMDSNEDWLVLGAPRENIDLDGSGEIEGENSDGKAENQLGAVYIYKRTSSGPVLHQTIVGFGNSNNGNGDRFGSAVTLFEDQLFIGAANDPDFPEGTVDPVGNDFFFAGKVYVYDYASGPDEWRKAKEELISDEPRSNGAYGSRTDAKHIVGFPEHGLLVVAEAGNGSDAPGKLHAYKNSNKGWVPAQAPITSPDFDEYGTETNLGDRLVGAGDSHLLASHASPASEELLVYRVGEDGLLNPEPVQVLPVVATDLVIPTGVENKIMTGFGIPKEAYSGFRDLFDDNQIFCAEVVGSGGSLVGMAAAGDVVVVGDACATPTGRYHELYGAVSVYSLDESSSTPLSLAQVLPGSTDSLFYGTNSFGGTQSIATDGQRIVIGGSKFLDYFGFPVKFWPILQEDPVDVYTLQDGEWILDVAIPTPEPSQIPDLGAFYGHAVSLPVDNDPSDGKRELLINRGGIAGQGGGKVYRFELSD